MVIENGDFQRSKHTLAQLPTVHVYSETRGSSLELINPLCAIVFTLATNRAERTENDYRAHCKVLYPQKRSIEPVANGTMIEVVALKLTGCRFVPQ